MLPLGGKHLLIFTFSWLAHLKTIQACPSFFILLYFWKKQKKKHEQNIKNAISSLLYLNVALQLFVMTLVYHMYIYQSAILKTMVFFSNF